MYGTPNDFKLQRIVKYTNRPKPIPKNPARYPKRINKKRKNLRWKPKEKSGIEKDALPVIATIIIKIGLTILALTAACP